MIGPVESHELLRAVAVALAIASAAGHGAAIAAESSAPEARPNRTAPHHERAGKTASRNAPGLRSVSDQNGEKDRARKAEAASNNALHLRDPRKLQSEHQQLQTRMARVKKSLADAEAAHSEAADALAGSETAISLANRRLRDLRAARNSAEQQYAAVRERQMAAAANQSEEQQQLGRLMRSQWRRALETDSQILMRGDDPVATRRALAYVRYMALAKAQTIGVLQDRRSELAALENEARDRQEELRRIAEDERRHRVELLGQQTERKRQVSRLGREIGRHRDSMAALERDESRLSGLIEQLAKERVTRQERAVVGRQTGTASGQEPPMAASNLPATGAFAKLRGRLPLPVNGRIAARFGAQRSTDGGASTWKGLLLQAEEGSEVRAVAAGRVVFADWLRGFGNLMLVDHGEGFLTVYGYNESLLRSVGEKVDAGDVIATVGDTGGSGQSGLYFEARFEGRPFDPLLWTAAR